MADANDKNDKNKGGLSNALNNALVKKDGEGSEKKGGLFNALVKKDDAVQKDEGPKKSNLDDIKKAISSTASTANAVKNDEARKKAEYGGICFVIDATASRSKTWKAAQRMQSDMFDTVRGYGKLNVGLIIFRNDVTQHLGWFADADNAKAKMHGIDCIGGSTRIVSALEQALRGNEGVAPSSVIMIGDCFEESYAALTHVCTDLNAKGVKVYAFHEGYDTAGENAYRTAAQMTGGVFKKFGEGLDIDLGDLVVAAAAFDIGGQAAFDKLLSAGHKGAKALLEDFKRRQIGYTPPNDKRLGLGK